MSEPTKPAPGMLATLAGSVLGLMRTHLELFSLEFEEERERLIRALVLGVIGAGALLLFLVTLTLAALLLTPPPHRWLTALVVTALYLLIAVVALLRARQHYAGSPPPFAATINELRKDREQLLK